MSVYSSLNFHLIRSLVKWNQHYNPKDKCIFLTFDDGPEPDITEFVLETLNRFGVKATFFCCGKNVELYPELFQRIVSDGHSVANHTYSHVNGLKCNSKDYIEDVEKGAIVTNSHIFRPPWGALDLITYLKLKRKFKIVLWDVVSNDTSPAIVDSDSEINRMLQNIKAGAVVLFHFVNKHADNTRILLPDFFKMALDKGYKFDVIK